MGTSEHRRPASSSRPLPRVDGADAAGDAADVTVGGWAVGGVAGFADSKSRRPDAQREATGSVAGGVDPEPLGGVEIDAAGAGRAAKFDARGRHLLVEKQRFVDSQRRKLARVRIAGGEKRGDGGAVGKGQQFPGISSTANATRSTSGGVAQVAAGVLSTGEGAEVDANTSGVAAKFAALRGRHLLVEKQRFLDSRLRKRELATAHIFRVEGRGDVGAVGTGQVVHSISPTAAASGDARPTGLGENVARVQELLSQTCLDPEKKRYYKARLSRLHKLKGEKSELEQKWRALRSKNREKTGEVMRMSVQVARAHGELVEARSRSEAGRKKLNEFEARLKRAVGVARLLPGYKARVEHLIRQLNEKEARMNVARGQVLDKLQSAMIRRDDTQNRHELLVTAINASAVKERSIAGDIARIRSETASNEQDLSAAQQLESQTKLRVETIEHEVSMERARHADAVADLESKAKEIESST